LPFEVHIRVRAERASIERAADLRDLPLRAPDGTVVKLSQVADLVENSYSLLIGVLMRGLVCPEAC
jgi:multidrug efflux pump subunit AcrB